MPGAMPTRSEERADADTAPTLVVQEQWGYWRGTPLLLAHGIRVMERAIKDETHFPVECRIDVSVDDDHEHFSSASDFLEHITEDALRRFSRVDINVGTLTNYCR